MFNFFKKKEKVAADLSFIGIDMHSHLLPGIDDGLQEVEKTVLFIKELKQLGYRKLICTPHVLFGLYPNSPATILPKLEMVRKALRAARVDMKIEAAAEYMIDHEFAELINKTPKEELLTIGGKYILVEMSYLSPSPNFQQVIFDLRILGLQPIIAHPERYSYYHEDFEQYHRFREMGCMLQVNLLSLSGAYGPAVKKTAEKLLKKQMVDFLGTDMHHDRHLQMLKELATRKEFYELAKSTALFNETLV